MKRIHSYDNVQVEDSTQKEEKVHILRHEWFISETERCQVWLEHTEQGAQWHKMRSKRARGKAIGSLAVLEAHALLCSRGIKYTGRGVLREESLKKNFKFWTFTVAPVAMDCTVARIDQGGQLEDNWSSLGKRWWHKPQVGHWKLTNRIWWRGFKRGKGKGSAKETPKFKQMWVSFPKMRNWGRNRLGVSVGGCGWGVGN